MTAPSTYTTQRDITQGSADPLRPDPTLQNLEAKSNRLMLLAARDDCLCVNLSELPRSRLTFQRINARRLWGDLGAVRADGLQFINERLNPEAMKCALNREATLGLIAPAGDYWNHADLLDPASLSAIDTLWLSSLRQELAFVTVPAADATSAALP